jgi:hypothetical protein
MMVAKSAVWERAHSLMKQYYDIKIDSGMAKTNQKTNILYRSDDAKSISRQSCYTFHTQVERRGRCSCRNGVVH